MAIGRFGVRALPYGTPAPQWSHVGFDPCLVDEH